MKHPKLDMAAAGRRDAGGAPAARLRRRYLDVLGSIYIYNEHRGYTALDRAFGHIDRFIEIMFGKTIDELDTLEVIHSDAQFEKLCRIISLTERRGHRQVDILLRNPLVRSDRILTRIFEIIEKDEPSHWAPYDGWLEANAKRRPRWWERAIDSFIHGELLVLKLPLLFLTPRLGRRAAWPDADDPAETRLSPARIAESREACA